MSPTASEPSPDPHPHTLTPSHTHLTRRAVEVLKQCVAVDTVSLLLSRDSRSQSEFKRLSQDFGEPATDTPQPKGILLFLTN